MDHLGLLLSLHLDGVDVPYAHLGSGLLVDGGGRPAGLILFPEKIRLMNRSLKVFLTKSDRIMSSNALILVAGADGAYFVLLMVAYPSCARCCAIST